MELSPAQREQRQIAALKGGVYARAPNGRRVRDRRVMRLTRKLIRACQWIDPTSDMPLARAWSEAEYVASWSFATLAQSGLNGPDGLPVRAFDQWRQARQLQAQLGRELGLSPSARMGLRVGDARSRALDRTAPDGNETDIAALEAQLLDRLADARQAAADSAGPEANRDLAAGAGVTGPPHPSTSGTPAEDSP